MFDQYANSAEMTAYFEQAYLRRLDELAGDNACVVGWQTVVAMSDIAEAMEVKFGIDSEILYPEIFEKVEAAWAEASARKGQDDA